MTPRKLILAWVGLIAGFIATLLLAQTSLGVWDTPLAVAIAFGQGFVVVAFFMEAKYSSRLTWFFVTGGIYWLGILFLFSLADYFSRGWLK